MRTLLAVLILLAVPTTALASDDSLERSWSRYVGDSKQLGKGFAADDIFDPRAAHRLYGGFGRLIQDARRSIAADTATTLTGGAAQEVALAHLRVGAVVTRTFDRAIPLLIWSLRARKRGERDRARALQKRFIALAESAAEEAEASERMYKQANKLFGAIARAS